MKRIILASIFILLVFFVFANIVPATAFADAKSEICKGIETASGSGCNTGTSLSTVVGNIINIFSIIIGVVAVIMIMFSGFKYITAGGDSGSVSSAKNTLIYAIIGLVVVALSQTIVRFVLDKA